MYIKYILEILFWSQKCMDPSWEVPNFDFRGKSFFVLFSFVSHLIFGFFPVSCGNHLLRI